MKTVNGSFMNRGVSLVELMIASTVSVIVITAVLLTFVNARKSSHDQSLARQLQENGRHALKILGEDIRMSGYYGLNIQHSTIDTSATDALTGSATHYGCGTADWAIDFQAPFSVSDNVNPYTSGCVPESIYVPETDVLTIRRVESNAVGESGIIRGHLYLQSSLTQGVTFRAEENDTINDEALTRVSENPAQTFKFATHVYHIRPCSVMDGSSCRDGIPTLVRHYLSANKVIVEPLIEFVENMQVTLGVDTTTPADGTVDHYVSPENVSEWKRVVSARIDLMVRSPEKMPRYRDSKKFNIGNDVVSVEGGYLRKVFSRTVFLRNPALPI